MVVRARGRPSGQEVISSKFRSTSSKATRAYRPRGLPKIKKVEQVIIKKKSNNNNKPLTNDEKYKLVEQTAEERLRESLKSDRINYLLNQIGAKL